MSTEHGHYMVESDSMRLAMRLVQDVETFHAHPTETRKEGLVIGFLRRVGAQGISRGEALTLLRSDLTGYMAELRRKIFVQGAERLGPPRIAVLLHLALVMGVQRVIDWSDLWADLARDDFDAAANHLLMSEWPSLIGDAWHERRRAVTLQQILRTGTMPRAADGQAPGSAA